MLGGNGTSKEGQCLRCGKDLRLIAAETSERYEYIRRPHYNLHLFRAFYDKPPVLFGDPFFQETGCSVSASNHSGWPTLKEKPALLPPESCGIGGVGGWHRNVVGRCAGIGPGLKNVGSPGYG